jgi:hypothetical protein
MERETLLEDIMHKKTDLEFINRINAHDVVGERLEQENMSLTSEPSNYWRVSVVLPHPEAFSVGNSQYFSTARTKVDITSA